MAPDSHLRCSPFFPVSSFRYCTCYLFLFIFFINFPSHGVACSHYHNEPKHCPWHYPLVFFLHHHQQCKREKESALNPLSNILQPFHNKAYKVCSQKSKCLFFVSDYIFVQDVSSGILEQGLSLTKINEQIQSKSHCHHIFFKESNIFFREKFSITECFHLYSTASIDYCFRLRCGWVLIQVLLNCRRKWKEGIYGLINPFSFATVW